MRPGLLPHLRSLRTPFLALLPLLLLSGVPMPLIGAQELIAKNQHQQSEQVKPSVLPNQSTPSSSAPIRLERILLLLQSTHQQQSDLNALLDSQITPGNALFHKWITPEEFAARFAPSQADAQAVVEWLKTQGFSVQPLPASRQWIEFSATTTQLEQSFGATVTPIPSDPTRYQLAGSPSSAIHLPQSIAAHVQGLVSLDGTQAIASATQPILSTKKAADLDSSSSQTQPQTQSQTQPLTPASIAGILHLSIGSASEHTSEGNGTGETIAIPTRSNVRPEDYAAFRKTFSLPESELAIQPNGPDPGRASEEAAAIQAASWASVAAPAAKILLVPAASTNATDGLDLALAAILDQAQANTVSIGYSSCESAMSPAHQAFYATLYQQAAAEGIAILAATGDSGAAACHDPTHSDPIRTGFAVNALASTPWNTAVGVAATASIASTESTSPEAKKGSSRQESLTPWQPAAASELAYATGGGASQLYLTPTWQSTQGIPESDSLAANPDLPVSAFASIRTSTTTPVNHHRYLPDLSLPAAADGTANSGLAYCYSGDTAVSGCRLVLSGGSAASAALFAGIAATLAQKYGPQGNLAPNLYALNRNAGTSALVFEDITIGSAQLPCSVGSTGCSAKGLIGYTASSGYDLASGLGSVNAQALIDKWATPQDIGTTAATVEMTTVGGVTYNPSATITLSAKVISGSGGTVPTGTVQFYDETTSTNTGAAVTLTADGIATYAETGQFTNGGHNIAAIYSGDSIYASAESQPFTINVQPSATALKVTPSTITPTGGSAITVTGFVTATNPGATAPTGLLTVNLDGIAQATATLVTTGSTTSATVSVTVPTSGAHTIQGTYSGDSNYNNSTSPSVTVTVTKTASVTTVTASPATITAGSPETFTATVAPAVAVAGTAYTLTGTVSFYDNGTTLLGTVAVGTDTAVLTGVTLSATTSHSVTAIYSGDSTYSTSTSTAVVLTSTLLPVTVTLTASTAVLSPGQAVTLTAVVTPVSTPPATAEQNPSGYVLFYAGKVLVGTQAPVVQSTGNSSVASTFVSSLPAGAYVLTAVYSGDPTYGPATSNSLNLAVEDFTVSCSSTSISMVQGSTQSVPCAVASLGGLTGSIQVVCEEQNPPTAGAITCTFSPSVILGSGSTDLAVVTTAGNISPSLRATSSNRGPGRGSKQSRRPWQAAGGGIALAFAGLLLSPIGRRARRLRALSSGAGRLLALTLLLTGMAAAGLGCSNTVTLTTNTGTPLGEHTLKITAAALVGRVTVSHYTYLTVNVTP